jgi:hypothetical protein
MKRTGFSQLVVVTVMVLSLCLATQGYARVDVNLDIHIPLPLYGFQEPPRMAPVPRSHAYFAPDIDVDIIFYHGYWYRPHAGRWYRADSYDGSWVYLESPRVPRAVIALPHGYRRIPPGYQKISHGDMNRNWRKWEKEKYWDRDEQWRGKNERGPESAGRGHK